MLKLTVLVAVCLFSLASAENIFSGFKKSIRLQMRDAGQGECDVSNPCANGDCEEDEYGAAICYCYYPYTGEFCEEICPLEQCWSDYWDEMSSFWGGDDTGDDDDTMWCEKRRTMTKSPGHLRKALEMKKRATLKKRDAASGDGRTYEKHCRGGMESMLECLDDVMADQSYCQDCTNDTITWIADVVERRMKLADEYCEEDWECEDPETAKCVEDVNKMFEIHYGENGTETVGFDKAAFHAHLDEVETCLIKIVNEELSLKGCIHNSWIKNEHLLFSVEVIRAEVKGCNLTKIGKNCKIDTLIENMDFICSLTVEERETELDNALNCALIEATNFGSVCDGTVEKIADAKSALIKESIKECKRIAKIDEIVGACDTQKTAKKWANLLRKLNKKDNEEILLELLLKSLVKGLK